MIQEIKNTKKPVKFLVNTNLSDISVLVREKKGMEWYDKLLMKFKIVDEYPKQITEDGGEIIIKEKIINDVHYFLFILEDYSLENLLDIVYNKYKEGKIIEDYINETLKNSKTIEFTDEIKDEDDLDNYIENIK